MCVELSAGCATGHVSLAEEQGVERRPIAYRCLSYARTVTGQELEVSGFGATQAEARMVASEHALYLAELRHGEALWSRLLQVELDGQPVRVDAVAGGHELRAGECEAIEARVSAQSGWRVSWGSFRVEGAELAASLERARRHACGKAYSRARLKALERTGAADAATRARAFTLGMDLAIEALLACYSDEGLARWEAHGAQGALSESRDGWFACQGDLRLPTSQPSEQKLQKTPHGLASTRAGAIEAAWRAYRRSQHRRAVAEALEAAASAPSDQRSVLVARALERATRDVGPSSLLEIRQSACGLVRHGALQSGWRHAPEQGCERVEAKGTKRAVSDPVDAAMVRGALCGLRAHQGFEGLGEALNLAEPSQRESMSWREHARLMGCEVACLEGASLTLTPLKRPGEAQGAPPWGRFEAAIIGRDLDVLAGLFPIAASEKAQRLILRAPDTFFSKLAELVEEREVREVFKAFWHRAYWYFEPRLPKPKG